MPLSGVISSYDHARFGASVSMPSVRRSHCPPHGPGRNVGRVRKGRPASSSSERRSESPSSERGASALGQVEVAVDPAGERLLVPVEHGPVDEEQPLLGAGAGRPAGRGSAPRPLASPRACARLGTSAYQRTSCSTSALPGPNTTTTSASRLARGRGRLVEEVRERSLEDAGEHGIAGKLGFGRAPQDLAPTGRTTRARRSKWSTAGATKRSATSSETRFQGSADEPSTASTQGVRAASSEAGTSKPLAGWPARDRVRRVRVVGHASRSSASAALHEKSPLPSASPVRGS